MSITFFVKINQLFLNLFFCCYIYIYIYSHELNIHCILYWTLLWVWKTDQSKTVKTVPYILGASEVSATLYCNSRTSALGWLRDYLRLLMKISVNISWYHISRYIYIRCSFYCFPILNNWLLNSISSIGYVFSEKTLKNYIL